MKRHHLDECSCCANAHEHTTELEEQIKDLLSTNEKLVDKCQRYEEALAKLKVHIDEAYAAYRAGKCTSGAIHRAKQALKGGGGE